MFTQPGRTIVNVAMVLFTVGLSTPGIAQLKLYDNFKSKHIDPSKWVGEPASLVGNSDKDRREVSVGLRGEEENRRLQILQTNYSATTDNNGAGGNGVWSGICPTKQGEGRIVHTCGRSDATRRLWS